MTKARIFLWGLVVVAAAVFAFLLTQRPESGPSEPVTATSFGGPFTLVGADGQPFQSSRLNGKPHAIFFGFTHCPDVCPVTLGRLVKLRRQLNQGERPFEIVFVTVDPERDGPAEVGQYASLFDSPIIGLTGSPAQIAQVKKQFGIYSEKQPATPDGNYDVNHTATVLLFDGKGDFVSTIAPDESDAAALAKLKRISS